jgi:hypothetical protein
MMKTTNYFATFAMIRHPSLKKEGMEYVLRHPIHRELQPNGRIRRWG